MATYFKNFGEGTYVLNTSKVKTQNGNATDQAVLYRLDDEGKAVGFVCGRLYEMLAGCIKSAYPDSLIVFHKFDSLEEATGYKYKTAEEVRDILNGKASTKRTGLRERARAGLLSKWVEFNGSRWILTKDYPLKEKG